MRFKNIAYDLATAIRDRDGHWYIFHAENLLIRGVLTEFLFEVSDALAILECHMPGSAAEYVRRIASIGGPDRERNMADYYQLEQILAELHILRRVTSSEFLKGATFEHEPTTTSAGKNPELLIETSHLNIAIEVKTPTIRAHREAMVSATYQATVRSPSLANIPFDLLPRDNPIKDALASANEKFSQLRQTKPDLVCILVILWDTMMHEVISALLHEHSGLFTDNTFDPQRRSFRDTDCVVIVPHQPQLILGPGDRDFVDAKWMFDFPRFPICPYITNPNSKVDPETYRTFLNAVFLAEDQRFILGAEYAVTDLVMWSHSSAGFRNMSAKEIDDHRQAAAEELERARKTLEDVQGAHRQHEE